DACAFDAAERDVSLATGGRRVDVRHAGFDFIDKAKDARGVVGEDRGRQTKFSVVRDVHRFFEILYSHHRQHWSKDFFARDAHVRRHVIENGRLDEETFVEAVTGCTFPAADKRRAVLAANVEIFEHRFELD